LFLGFQLIRFEVIGELGYNTYSVDTYQLCFQLIRFEVIGEPAATRSKYRGQYRCFQLIRFEVIGELTFQEPLPRNAFRHQIARGLFSKRHRFTHRLKSEKIRG